MAVAWVSASGKLCCIPGWCENPGCVCGYPGVGCGYGDGWLEKLEGYGVYSGGLLGYPGSCWGDNSTGSVGSPTVGWFNPLFPSRLNPGAGGGPCRLNPIGTWVSVNSNGAFI